MTGVSSAILDRHARHQDANGRVMGRAMGKTTFIHDGVSGQVVGGKTRRGKW
jgi:hypothetical protein